MDDIFKTRIDAFRYGYASFSYGFHESENPYKEDRSDDEFFANREWQAGWNLGYTDMQQYWSNRS